MFPVGGGLHFTLEGMEDTSFVLGLRWARKNRYF